MSEYMDMKKSDSSFAQRVGGRESMSKNPVYEGVTRPILFSSAMIRCLLEGRKTMTRRVIKFPRETPTVYLGPDVYGGYVWEGTEGWGGQLFKCPYGKVGDRLYVRETWHALAEFDRLKPRDVPHDRPIYYAATDQHMIGPSCDVGKVRQSIFLPSWASRITLEITEVRVERVAAISRQDATAEGIAETDDLTRYSFAQLWDSINGKKPGCSWSDNPFVWVIGFRVVTPEGTGYLATEPAHNAPPPEGKENLGIGEKRSCNQEQDTKPKGGG